jgi:uncharacterized protein YbaA (DUF1428 family)
MSYIDGVILAAPADGKQAYIDYAKAVAAIFMDYGATEIVDGWGDDVPEGKVTDYHRAVQAQPGETVVFSWILWPDKATRDLAWTRVMEDSRMGALKMPFDGKRMIYGGFERIAEL